MARGIKICNSIDNAVKYCVGNKNIGEVKFIGQAAGKSVELTELRARQWFTWWGNSLQIIARKAVGRRGPTILIQPKQ